MKISAQIASRSKLLLHTVWTGNVVQRETPQETPRGGSRSKSGNPPGGFQFKTRKPPTSWQIEQVGGFQVFDHLSLYWWHSGLKPKKCPIILTWCHLLTFWALLCKLWVEEPLSISKNNVSWKGKTSWMFYMWCRCFSEVQFTHFWPSTVVHPKSTDMTRLAL